MEPVTEVRPKRFAAPFSCPSLAGVPQIPDAVHHLFERGQKPSPAEERLADLHIVAARRAIRERIRPPKYQEQEEWE